MKRMLINGAAMLVITAGGALRLSAEDPSVLPPACCHTVFTSASCCGDTCQSGWFNCTAQVK